MANERFWASVPTQAFISNGGSEGQVQVLNTRNLKVKMQVFVKSNTQPQIPLEVKKVLNSTDIVLGPKGGKMRGAGSFTNLTAYLQADSASVRIDEQERPSIILNEINRAVFEEEPAVAIRTIDVDPMGTIIDWSEDGLVPQEYDDVEVIRDDEGDPIEVKFYLNTILIRDLEILYDDNKDVIRVRKKAGSL